MNDGDRTDPSEELRRLRQRVAALEEELARARPEGREDETDPHDPWRHRELAEREALLSEAERIAHMGSWVWDLNTERVGWSDELFRILGYRPGEVQASRERFEAAVHPEDLPRLHEAQRHVLETGAPFPMDIRVLRPDGTVRELSMQGAAVQDAEGHTVRLIGTLLDVTDQRAHARTLEQNQYILNEAQRIANIGTWEWAVDSDRVWWSPQVRRILGLSEDYEPGDDDEFLQLVHPADRERVRKMQAAGRAGDPGPGEFRVIRADGSVGHVRVDAAPFRDERGRVVRVIGTILDITERKQLEAQLLQSQKMEAIGRLAGGIAHDFNNLLLVIMGNAELLKLKKPGSEAEEIRRAAEIASQLTQQLLAFSRQAPGGRRATDLTATVSTMAGMLKTLIGENVSLEVASSPDTWPIYADEAQLKQIIVNLVINARDAMTDGGRIELKVDNAVLDADYAATHPQVDPGAYVCLSVADEGHGMDETTQAKIFEPFFTTKESGHGTGLGLSTVFGLMSQMGGHIDVESERGRGAKFMLYFPRYRRDVSSRLEGERRGLAKGSGKIVVVEDDDTVRGFVGRTLREAGYEVRTAADPAQVEAMVREDTPQLLIADMFMPGMSGPELVERLAQLGKRPRVLYMTGYAAESVASAEDLAHLECLQKPFSPQELLDRVAGFLGGAAK